VVDAGSDRGRQDSHRDTSDASCERNQTGGYVEMAGDHAAQSTVATMGRKVERIALVGGEDGALLVSMYVHDQIQPWSQLTEQAERQPEEDGSPSY
jgi:hypothetical protein